MCNMVRALWTVHLLYWNRNKPIFYLSSIYDNNLWVFRTEFVHHCTFRYHNGKQRIETPLITKFLGPIWGPAGADRTQVGSMLAPWTLLSGTVRNVFHKSLLLISKHHWPLGKQWKRIGVMLCKTSPYPNGSGALTNCSGRLIAVPEDL